MLEFNSNSLVDNYFKQIHTLLNSKELDITYSGNYKNREKKIIGQSYIPRLEVSDYNINFQKFPTRTQLHQHQVEINHYFFEYYLIGQSESDPEEILNYNIDHFFQYEIPEYVEMNRAEMLYNALLLKHEQLTELYPASLTSITKELQIENTSEEVQLINSIKKYTTFLNDPEEQLVIFNGVIFSKKITDLFTKIIITFLQQRLSTICPTQANTNYFDEQETEDNINSNPIYVLPENFSLTKEKIKASNLDIRQVALLFYYLRKKEAIINYSDASLAKFVHYLTGHSELNLRQKKGFGNIINIEKEIREDENFHNIKMLKSFLEDVISDIDKKIDSN